MKLMWNPAVIVKHPALLINDRPFQTVCDHFHAFYTQYVKNFEMLAMIVMQIHKKYGMQEALVKGVTSSLEGDLILRVTLHPTYKLKFGDPDYSARDKAAFAEDYFTEFTAIISARGCDLK